MGGYDIAVIGLAGRFPGAGNPDEFWTNLRNGVESVQRFTDAELIAAGESRHALQDLAYVKAQPILADFDKFDAGVFGFSPQDAAVMDPQHRLFLEVGWEALEDAGHASANFAGTIGVFAACGMNSYMMYNLVNNRRIMQTVGEWLVRHTGNDMNFLATRLSYVLNLTGPSMNVQTACSSALVGIHLACQSLLSGECDMALSGGSTVVLPHGRGYVYRQGEILSPDGHCRPFDANARGTLFGSGAGVVVLRRLSDAQADGDRILAVIKGSAINNDGNAKVGYLAPSVDGQARAITEAITVSDVHPETISYVEMHGTGTIVGDPIEVTALTQAWRHFTDKRGICAIGSLKSNIGHLGEAAGVAAFIKTVLMLKHKEIPASLNYESPNPQIDFAASPFFVNDKLEKWTTAKEPRRAAITSLGAGGTNCHVIVEEAPAEPVRRHGKERSRHLLQLSAHTPTATLSAAKRLSAHLRAHPETNLADAAFTLSEGRKQLAHRLTVVCKDSGEAISALEALIAEGTPAPATEPRLVFMFPGQGAQYVNMGRALYDSENVFREEFDRCAELLREKRGLDLKSLVFSDDLSAEAQTRLNQTFATQPALFAVEYALAKLWESWGLSPQAMIGHSIGEYVAACLAGVMPLADAISLVADRGALMQKAPTGSMLAVALSSEDLKQRLECPGAEEISIAAHNAPSMSVIAGPSHAINAFENTLKSAQIQTQHLRTSHAFHSALMDPVLREFGERTKSIQFKPPEIPYISNLTGTWIRADQATDPNYWVQHLRQAVRFSEGLETILQDPNTVLLETGPGQALSSLARLQPANPAAIASSFGRTGDKSDELATVLRAMGKLWIAGLKLDTTRFYAGQTRRRIALPTYPFERKRHWIDPSPSIQTAPAAEDLNSFEASESVPALEAKTDIADWFYLPAWKRSIPPSTLPTHAYEFPDWLVFLDETGVGADWIRNCQTRKGPNVGAPSVRLKVTAGDLDSLILAPEADTSPGPGEVKIHVQKAALNFADVLYATGVLPAAPFGMECAGVIEAIGTGVTQFRIGDEVVAIGPESFCSHLVRNAEMVAPKPALMTLDEAATLPAAFMTAWYALNHVGKLGRGEKVLIHAASGGVGLAAIQIAHLLGAEVFATAGNEAKRDYLRSIGIKNVYDSRALSFEEEILKSTHGAGVDIVLNSLTGDFITKSFNVLSGGGRFIEIGKRELYTAEQVAKAAAGRQVSYHAIDLAKMHDENPKTYADLLREVVAKADAGEFAALKRTVFSIADATQAFQLMTQTKHIGKVILSFDCAGGRIFTVRAGKKFHRVGKSGFVLDPTLEEDYSALVDALETSKARIGRIAHFWQVPKLASGGSVERALERGFFSLTWLGKAFGMRDWSHPIDIALVSTGLHQVFEPREIEPLKATALGPCRVLPRELRNVTCRSIDLPRLHAAGRGRATVIEQLTRELGRVSNDRDVAYRGKDRWVQSIESARIESVRAKPALREKGVYLISGGMGDLGLAVAEHFARLKRARLVLVARTTFPEPTEWPEWLRTHIDSDPVSEKIRRLQACQALGGEILIVKGDITDRARMKDIVSEVAARFGQISGVIHCAGALDDGLIQLKTKESALAVLRPKVEGARVLSEVLHEAPLDFFILFSSIGSLLGLEGQVDYTAANAFLDSFAEARSRRTGQPTVSIGWGAWKEIGMAARSSAGRHDPTRDGKRPRHPWLDALRRHGDEFVFTTQFSAAKHWVLGEHVVKGGDALIPGTGFLELARAAFAEIGKSSSVELSQVVFQAPFSAKDSATEEMQIVLRRTGAGWDFEIRSRGGKLTHVNGKVRETRISLVPAVDLDDIFARCSEPAEVLHGFIAQPFMNFGPRWGNVESIRYGQAEALVTLVLPQDFADDLNAIALHPALLDMATGGALRLHESQRHQEDFYVPVSYGKLTQFHALPAKLFSHVRRRDRAARDTDIFDITLADESGKVLAEISEFVMRKVADIRALSSAPAAATAPASAGNTLAQEIFQFGMRPEQALEALDRILGSDVGEHVAVSPLDPALLARRLDADIARQRALGDGASRPGARNALKGETTERRIAALMAHMLGVPQVMPCDDFFELGGHSLLAVRLLTRIEKEFGTAIALPKLFERPTSEGLASFIANGKQESREQFPAAIVPFNTKGDRLPFYCVHSVAGDVMSFRHLSKLLGENQPFFGIQAPPEKRNAQFANSVEAIAQYYVDALVDFQPEGAFVLGGWSAGSTVALEMAQQLKARGREVALLVALDGAPFNTGAGTKSWNPLYYWKLACNLPLWIADDLCENFSFESIGRRIGSKLASLVQSAKLNFMASSGKPTSTQVESFLDVSNFSSGQVEFMNTFYDVLRKYTARQYDGPVLVYAAQTQPLYHLFEVEPKWAAIASQLEAVAVRGTHESIIKEPHVQRLAADLSSRLETVWRTAMQLEDTLPCRLRIAVAAKQSLGGKRE